MQFGELIDNLRFLQPAMSDGGKNRIPVMKAVLADNNILIFRFVDLGQLNAFRLAKSTEKFSSSGDILRLQFMPEPLIDFILSGSRFCKTQPVSGRSTGVEPAVRCFTSPSGVKQ